MIVRKSIFTHHFKRSIKIWEQTIYIKAIKKYNFNYKIIKNASLSIVFHFGLNPTNAKNSHIITRSLNVRFWFVNIISFWFADNIKYTHTYLRLSVNQCSSKSVVLYSIQFNHMPINWESKKGRITSGTNSFSYEPFVQKLGNI